MVIYFFTAIAIIAVICCLRLILLMLMPFVTSFIKFLLNWQKSIKPIRKQFIGTAPERFANGKILWADKVKLNSNLEGLLRGASLEENYNCLVQDLKSMTDEEKNNLILNLHSEYNVFFTEKELNIIYCIMSKIIFDSTSDYSEKLVAQVMSEEVQTLSNFNDYHKQYENSKFIVFALGETSMIDNLQKMFDCKDKESLSTNFNLLTPIFDKYTNALKEYIINKDNLLEILMTEPQENLFEEIDKLNDINSSNGER